MSHNRKRTWFQAARIAGSFAAIAGLTVGGCESTGTWELEGNFLLVSGKITGEWKGDTDNPGTQLGSWTDEDGNTSDLYDLDGDGTPDIARDQETGKWYIIKSIELVPIGPVPGPQSQSMASGFSGGLQMSLVIGQKKIYHFGPGSSLDSKFDFTGETTASLLSEYGWSTASAGTDLDLDAYQDGELYQGQVVELYWVVPTRTPLPSFEFLELEVAVAPLFENDGTFTVYGLAIKGHATEIAAFAAELDITEFSFEFDEDDILVEIDSSTSTAEASQNGVVFDTFTF